MLLATMLTIAVTLQLGGAAAASAATTCASYDAEGIGISYIGTGYIYGWPGDSYRNVRVCEAPASDFPTHSGWGRINILEPEFHCPEGASCRPPAYQSPPAWRWTGRTWLAIDLFPSATGSLGFSGFSVRPAGLRAYLAPFVSGWRWAWTHETGWVAIREANASFRWWG